MFGGIQPQPLPFQIDGTLDLDAVEAAIKPDDFHFAKTRLLCLENTLAGVPLPLDYLPRARALCDRRKLAMHLDGARLFNAAVAQRVRGDDTDSRVATACRCVCRKVSAHRRVRCCAAPRSSFVRRAAGARCSAAACGSPAYSPPRGFMR